MKTTRDKTRIYSIPHDDSDYTRKYGFSKSIIQALIMTLLQTMSACIMDQRSHTFSFGHYHQAPGASCGKLYILVLSLVLFMQSHVYI